MQEQTEASRHQTEINRENVEAVRRRNELKEYQIFSKGAEIQLTDMPMFDGSDGFALIKFFQDFDRCRSVGRWGSVSALSWLKSSLRGLAAKVFEKSGPFDNFNQAKQALLDKFLQAKDRRNALRQVMSLKQQNGQSVRD